MKEFNSLVGNIFVRGVQNVIRRLGYEYIDELKQQIKKEKVGN